MATYLQKCISASVLILAAAAIRALTLYKLPKQTFMALWGIILCRLWIPVSIPSPFSIYSLTDKISGLTDRAAAPTPLVPAAGIAAGVQPNGMGRTYMAAGISPYGIVWIIGAVGCALFFLVTHLRRRREYRTALPVADDFFSRWLTGRKPRRRVQVRQSDKVSSPLTYGVLRPVILLPKTTDWTDENQLRYVFTHEYTHIRRFDVLKQWLLAATLCVHWFNPLVWLMYVLAARDIELSCDEKVVRTFGVKLKASYARALVGMEERRNARNPVSSGFGKNAIEERINAIMKMKSSSLVRVALALALVAGMGIVFATSAAPPESGTVPQDTASDWAQYDKFGNLLTYHTVDKNGGGVYLDYEPKKPEGDVKIMGEDTVSFFSQRVDCVAGVSGEHKRANGEMAVYTNNGGAWALKSGQKVTITFETKRVEGHGGGQSIWFGYEKDGEYTRYLPAPSAAGGAGLTLLDTTEIPFVAPEDGDYCFFMVNFSSDTIYVERCTVSA